MTSDIDTNLFPVPSRHGLSNKNLVLPRSKPGVSPASTTALQAILTDNHKRWHVFFNFQGFHNHTAHTALTLWCLGADASVLKGSYEDHSKYQRPAFPSPNNISSQTWKDHLGDDNYYHAYLEFFKAELKEKSFDVILEEYVFAPSANFATGLQKQPEMLNRFFDGLLHPIIHTGFGVEFTLPGTFAEGLAQTAVHGGDSSRVIPSSWFIPLTDKEPKQDIHAFSILARILADPSLGTFKEPDPSQQRFYLDVMENYGDTIVKYVDQWTLDGELAKKVQELQWTNVLLYAVGGSEANGPFNADFFLMHLVTSSLFLSGIFAELKRPSQVELLRGYFAICLSWYIGRGRPTLDIARFFNNPDTYHPSAPGPQPTPHEGVNPSPSSPAAITPNPWFPIMQSTLVHPDDHLPKLQRALSEYSTHFGLTPAGTFKDTELKDAGLVDGTLFLRAAGLSISRLGWVREGQPPLEGSWDRRGFFTSAQL
ncbi:hypothetical protein BDZ97DRAFT_1658223 [Flammula alnicola]|nr:hypothetical protein BDZ97DRAFT_1658223 [Flammula alnicola]